MIAGTINNIKTTLDIVREKEPCFVFLGRNPLAAETLRYYYKRCLSSGKLNESEIEVLKGWVKKFEQYQPQDESLLSPNNMATPKDDILPPRPKPEAVESSINESPVTEKFAEDRAEVNVNREEETSEEETSEEKENEDEDEINSAIDNI